MLAGLSRIGRRTMLCGAFLFLGVGVASAEKYDDASWHYDANFPEDLSNEAAGIHIAMFVTWALLSGMGSEFHEEYSSELLADLQARNVTPNRFFWLSMDGVFTDGDLNSEGRAFALEYYGLGAGPYLGDYLELLTRGLPSVYHVEDSWETFDRLRPVLDARLQEWRQSL